MTGEELYKKASLHIGEKYKLGTLVPKNDAKWKGPWDCAEFTSWLVYQVSGKLYGCYNNIASPNTADAYTGYWKRDAETAGKIITVETATVIPGAAILRIPATGLIGHIVISDGKGGTIEAHSTKKGVIKSVVSGRRWDYGILVPGIIYTNSSANTTVSIEQPDVIIYRYTNPMMVSSKIGIIQRALTKSGFSTKGANNVFGINTMNAVVAFQQAKGLVADGEVGRITARALNIKIYD
ncbi:MAG: peptidoglycan-binding domain-containing protein [Ferruginibacter sp.]